MKVAGRDARRFCADPPAGLVGALLYGEDTGLVADRRREIIAAILAAGTDDLQVTRLDASEARRDPAAIEAALTNRGFFAGREVVLIEGGTDGLAKPLETALERVTPDDGFLVVTAAVLPARSNLRKFFEKKEFLASIGIYTEATSLRDIEDTLRGLGAKCGLTTGAAAVLQRLAAEMDHGSFRRLLELVALCALDRSEPLDAPAVEALAPAGLETDIDRFVTAVAGGDTTALGSLLRRLQAGGATPVGVLIQLQRHFRMLLQIASSESGLARVRPPLWGARREEVTAQLNKWTGPRLEQANRLLFDTDGRLRSSDRAPDFALLERAALRLAIMAAR